MNKLIAGLKRLIRRPFEMHKDLKLECVECGNLFRFEWGEQQFYKSRGLTPPKRCSTCRSGGKGRSFRQKPGRDNARAPRPAANGHSSPSSRPNGRRDDRKERNDAPRAPREDTGSSRYIDDRPFYGEERPRNRDRDRRR
jgi:hypothetical protein